VYQRSLHNVEGKLNETNKTSIISSTLMIRLEVVDCDWLLPSNRVWVSAAMMITEHTFIQAVVSLSAHL